MIASRSLLSKTTPRVASSQGRLASAAFSSWSPSSETSKNGSLAHSTTAAGSNLRPRFHSQKHIIHHMITPCTATTFAVRWKHAARKGNHLEVLDDMAHTQEREKAQERRQKKKDRKLKKKKGKKGGDDEAEAASPPAAKAAVFEMEGQHNNDSDDHFDDDFDDDDDDDGEDEVELPDPKKIEEKMMTMIGTYEESLKSIRGAEPTPELFDDILVNAYGSDTPLKAVAQVVITSPTMASITCFDPSVVKEVRASIQLQLGLNPQADASEGDAGVLKVPLPKVSLESRQKTAQQLSKKAEAFRKRIRKVRRRYNGIIKQGKEGKLEHISKDDVFRVAGEIDDATDKAIKKLNDVTDKKHANIMDV